MGSVTRRRFLQNSVLISMGVAGSLSEGQAQGPAPTGRSITVAVVQQAREPRLEANRDKIVRFVGQAKGRGCRLVIFPEDALGAPVGTSNEDLEKAVDAVREAARSNNVYVIFCAPFPIPGFAPDRRGHRLRVIGPDGGVLQQYNKLICNIPASDPRRAPDIFHVDGIPCCAMICADRWLRGLEELPVTLGAKLLIDCSANARKEWIPEFAWYLPVTRALRNNVYSIFCNMGEHAGGLDEARHGHSAIIHPDGSFAAAADDAGDQMLVATLDLSKAHGAEAARRHNHPVFKPYWDLGRRMLQGEKAHIALPEPYASPQVEITIAAAQMACSRDIPANLDRMARLIGEAAGKRADVVVFPELTVTGAISDDIVRADAAAVHEALGRIQSEARTHGITVVFGMPHTDGDMTGGSVEAAGLVRSVPVRAYLGLAAQRESMKITPYGVTTNVLDAATQSRARRRNSAFVVGPDGSLLTRYDQMVVDRRDLFEEGSDAKATWFKVKGVPAIVTIGSDACWNEIGELAAVRGAQLLFNLSYDEDTSDAAALRRTQFWVQLASFCTFSATVNAADASGASRLGTAGGTPATRIARPSAPANGGSAIWEDFDGHRKKPAGEVEVFSQYSASRVVSAGREETILYATRTIPKLNTYFQRLVARRYPHLEPWYHLGARIIAGDAVESPPFK